MTSPNLNLFNAPIACPDCTKLFRLPENFKKTSKISCPHCSTISTGEQILAAALPTAGIVESRNEDVEPKIADGSSKASQAFDEGNFSIPQPLKSAKRSTSSRSSHPSRRKSSSKKSDEPDKYEWLKVAFGALLALPIMLIFFWWVFNADPLRLSKPTYNIAPFLVPPKLRPADEAKEVVLEKETDLPKSQELNDFGIPPMLTPKEQAP